MKLQRRGKKDGKEQEREAYRLSLWTSSQRVKDFWMTPGRGSQPVGINHVARTEISQTWPSDDGLAVDFVTHPFIGWAINWPSMGVARRLTSENEWGVWGGERWAPSPALVCWVISQPWVLPCHYSSVPWLEANQFPVLWATSEHCMISSREKCIKVKNKNPKSCLRSLKVNQAEVILTIGIRLMFESGLL